MITNGNIKDEAGIMLLNEILNEKLENSLREAGYRSIGSKYLDYPRPGYGTRKRVLVWGKK